jgi:two-component system sensor histidine kinase AlgZ
MARPPEPGAWVDAPRAGAVGAGPAREAEGAAGPSSTWFGDLDGGAAPPTPVRAAADGELCRSGAVLRALLLVHLSLGIGLAFVDQGGAAWAAGLAGAATIAVPATLLWLMAACLLSRTGLAQYQGRPRRAPSHGGSTGLSGGSLGGPIRGLFSGPFSAPFSGLFGGLFGGPAVARGVTLVLASALGAAAVGLVWWPLQALALAPAALAGPGAPMAAGALLAGVLFHWISLRGQARLPTTTAAHLAELQTRVRPHFLFNTLNTAIALVRIDPARAEQVLEDLADLFHAALGTADEVSTLGREVELARHYLAIEALRFAERLRVDWQIDATAQDARLPPLLLQPLVENAVRHGVEPSAEGASIRIRTQRHGDRVHITVSNSVPTAPSRPGHGIGLASVRDRLRLLHDLDAEFHSGLDAQGLFQVRIGVPSR